MLHSQQWDGQLGIAQPPIGLNLINIVQFKMKKVGKSEPSEEL